MKKDMSNENNLEPNENLFIVLNGWMEKYDSSVRVMSKSGEDVPSVCVEMNQKSLPSKERTRVIRALKKWSIKNKKIVIVTATCISIVASSAIMSIAKMIFIKSDEKGTTTSFFDAVSSPAASGVFYLDENNSIAVADERYDDMLDDSKEFEIKPDMNLSGNYWQENKVLKNLLNDSIGSYMKTRYMETSVITVDATSKADSLEPEEELFFQDAENFLDNSEVSGEEIIQQSTSFVNESGALEIVIPSDVKQTGLCPNYTGYDKFYGKWSKTSMQSVLSIQWGEAGMPSSQGIATLNDRYLVAVSAKFGVVGDYIDIVLKDGQIIPAIIADCKGADAESEWGHVLSGRVDIVEWEAAGPKEEIDLGTWANIGVEKIVNYGQQDIPVYDDSQGGIAMN